MAESEDIQKLLEQYSELTVEQLEAQEESAGKKQVIKPSVVSPSKRRTSIEISNIGPSAEDRNESTFSLKDPGVVEYDFLREAGGKYWSNDDNGVTYVAPGGGPNAGAKVLCRFHVTPKREEALATTTDYEVDLSPFFEVVQQLHLMPEVDMDIWGDNLSEFEQFLTGLDGENPSEKYPVATVQQMKSFGYFNYSSPLPYSDKELERINLPGCQYVKASPEYNFFIKRYENEFRTGQAQNQTETLLPNLYSLHFAPIEGADFASLSFGSNGIADPHMRHNSLNGKMRNASSYPLSPEKALEFLSAPLIQGQYFENFAQIVSDEFDDTPGDGSPLFPAIMEKGKNLVVPYGKMAQLKEISRKKELFPMFLDIEFTTDRQTHFAQMLADTNLLDEFTFGVIKRMTDSDSYVTNKTFINAEEVSNAQEQEDGSIEIKKISQVNTNEKRTWDIIRWLQYDSLIDSLAVTGDPEELSWDELHDATIPKTLFLSEGDYEQKFETGENASFSKNLLNVIFISKLKQLVKDKMVTYDEILEGKLCHSEDVVYRIEKSLADEEGNPTSNVIQNFWIPNSNDVSVVNFIDTQIKYGKRYAYRFYAYRLVIDTTYYYQGLTPSGGGVFANMAVIQTPKVTLVEEEIFSINHIIMDDPPLSPEVNIIPYFANGKNLLFNLNGRVGEEVLDPILLDMFDHGQHDDVKIAQKLKEGDKIRFKGDDNISAFEIYRIDTRPRSWDDFDARILATVSNEGAGASTGEYVDEISSNKKYYYTFRAIDNHGHVSNPTDIYEVELVNDEGSVYLNKRIIELYSKEPRHGSKPMRRLLEIKPAAEQTFIDTDGKEESAFDFTSLKLGHLQESPWGRKFKFRIVSRKTGKKMDLNVDFKAELDEKSKLV